jgi:hypothetical protein
VPRRFIDLEHDCRDQLAPLGNQRVVCRELILQLSVAALLDVQHLLDLLPYRVVVLEMKDGEETDLDPPLPFDLGDPAALISPHGRIFRDRQDVLAGQPALGAR